MEYNKIMSSYFK